MKSKKTSKKRSYFKGSWSRVIGFIVFLLLSLSVIFAVVRLIGAPYESPVGDEFIKIKSDYALMVAQCTLAIIVMFLPSVLEKRFDFAVPDLMSSLYYAFLFAAVYLGEVRNFYYIFPHWDTVLHTLSGAMLGALGFVVVRVLNESHVKGIRLSPFFVSLFAFCFALSAGAIWEIYEFIVDSALGLNMQKWRLEDGTVLVGMEALKDTMVDLIADALSALVVVTVGYFAYRRDYDIEQAEEEKETMVKIKS